MTDCGCEKAKADVRKRAAEWKAECDADPKACEAKKAKMRKRAAEWKEKCEAHAKACERKKARIEHLMKKHYAGE